MTTTTKRPVGRPPIEPTDLVTLDKAIQLMREELLRKYAYDPSIADQLTYSKQTLYNKICRGVLRRFGPPGCALVSKSDILKLVG
jgi:hypothetical protein